MSRAQAAESFHLDALPAWTLPGLILLLTVGAGLVLPAEFVFLIGPTVALGIGIGVAGLRRHGGPGVPVLPSASER